MVLSHYTAIVFFSAFAMLSFMVATASNHFMEKKRRLWFQVLFALIVVLNICEWGAAMLTRNVPLISLRTTLKFLELSLTPFVGLVGILAAGGQKLLKLGSLLCFANLLLQIVSLFTGCVFFMDADCVYHRSTLYSLYSAISFLMIVLAVLDIYLYSKRFQAHNLPLLAVIFFMTILTLSFQIVLAYLRLDWVAMTFVVIFLYIFSDHLQQQIDALTGLLNRKTFEAYIHISPQDCFLLFIDINHFKEVNDVYGHAVGDECLQKTAEEIKKVFAKHGLCFRYGGDEFCVFMRKRTQQIQNLIDELNANIALAQYHDGLPLPSVSCGYSVFDGKQSFSEVIEQADIMMYKNKRK